MKFLLFFALTSAFCFNSADAITNYYMDENCNRVLDISYIDSIRLKLTKNGLYKSNMDCYLIITSDYTLSHRFMLYFRDFDVESNMGCTNDWLEVHDGNSINSPYVSGLSGRLCGSYMGSTVRKTSGSKLYLRFRSDGSWQQRGFEMIITQYHTGICDAGEFSCSNGRCVSYGLVCNGYNPCGDHSDCDVELAAGVIVGIVLGSIGFTIFMVVIVIVSCRRRRRRHHARFHQPVNVVATTAPNYGAGYNQPVPQQYPPVSSNYPTGQQYPTSQYPNQPYPN